MCYVLLRSPTVPGDYTGRFKDASLTRPATTSCLVLTRRPTRHYSHLRSCWGRRIGRTANANAPEESVAWPHNGS